MRLLLMLGIMFLAACGGSSSAPASNTDTTSPLITLLGSPSIVIDNGVVYIDDGATANDDIDGDISLDINIVNNVDTLTAGDYQVTYNVSDSANNAAPQVVRNVRVETVCRSGFPEQSTSAYILPYSVGSTFIVGQGSCTDGSHSDDQAYAYDFDMPIGTDVAAARAGIVIAVVENFAENNDTPGQENFIFIQHDDNRVSGYFHITLNGSLVEVGDIVSQGDSIALSGNTGDSSAPHLHFEVATGIDEETLPINFRNTREHTNGLVENEFYEALSF